MRIGTGRGRCKGGTKGRKGSIEGILGCREREEEGKDVRRCWRIEEEGKDVRGCLRIEEEGNTYKRQTN